jgi:hypothetical protein
MILPIIFLYILPAILSVIILYSKQEQVTRGDLIEIIMIAIIPAVNLFLGYLGGLVVVARSTAVQDFLNKRIK